MQHIVQATTRFSYQCNAPNASKKRFKYKLRFDSCHCPTDARMDPGANSHMCKYASRQIQFARIYPLARIVIGIRQRLSLAKSANPTPRAEQNVRQSLSASLTSL